MSNPVADREAIGLIKISSLVLLVEVCQSIILVVYSWAPNLQAPVTKQHLFMFSLSAINSQFNYQRYNSDNCNYFGSKSQNGVQPKSSYSLLHALLMQMGTGWMVGWSNVFFDVNLIRLLFFGAE